MTEMELEDKIENKFNIIKRLGSGTCGVAFLTSDGKVLKLTDSISEKNLAKKLIKTPAEHYVKIYNVWKIVGTNKFLILKDFADELSRTERDYAAIAESYFKSFDNVTINDINEFKNTSNYTNRLFKQLKININLFSEFLIKYKEMLDELKDYDVFDITSYNLGWSMNGNLCGFDFMGKGENSIDDEINLDEQQLLEFVRKRGNSWFVFSKKGKKLGGPYNTKEVANKRLGQIEYFKNKG